MYEGWLVQKEITRSYVGTNLSSIVLDYDANLGKVTGSFTNVNKCRVVINCRT